MSKSYKIKEKLSMNFVENAQYIFENFFMRRRKKYAI